MGEKQEDVNRTEGGEEGQTEADVFVCVLAGRKGMIISPLIIWF